MPWYMAEFTIFNSIYTCLSTDIANIQSRMVNQRKLTIKAKIYIEQISKIIVPDRYDRYLIYNTVQIS